MTVHQFGTFDAKNRLSHLLDLVEQGDEVVITRNDKPVARLRREGGAQADEVSKAALRTAERLRRRREAMPADKFEPNEIREMIGDGRL